MRISLQLGMIPGESTADKAKWAYDHGAEGLELGVWGGGLEKCRRDADAIHGLLPISSVCGNADPSGEPCFGFLDPDPQKRRKSIEGSKGLLTFCGEVGAAGQIVPPIFGGPKEPELADGFMDAALQELGPHAASCRTLFLLEPLNRYEQRYLCRVGDAVKAIVRSGETQGVGVLADLFHMNIEETDSPRALQGGAPWVRHVHLADNTRHEPGSGDIDFAAAFAALKESGFTGWMAYECSVQGATPAEKAQNLARSLEFVRGLI